MPRQPKNARATSYHSGGTVFSSAVASASETSTIAVAVQRGHPAEAALVDELGRLQPVARREHAVARGRRAAALDVAEHGDARLEPGPRLDLLRERVADAAEHDVAELVGRRAPRRRRAATRRSSRSARSPR